jgi:glutamine amidotransferase
MIAIVDYGMGNLRSVAKAIERMGGRARVISTPAELAAAPAVILPGVGAFGDAMEHLDRLGLVEPLRRKIAEDRPFLGICLGLQLLFQVSHEEGRYEGLGVLKGQVRRFDFSHLPADRDLAVPHMGWNTIQWERPCPLWEGLAQGSYVYFVHSYCVVPEDPLVQATWTDYGGPFTSSIRRGNLFATQFHPEKSQAVGMKILENFVRLAGE